MLLKDILKAKGTHVWTIREDDSIQDALRELVDRRIGALLVLDNEGQIAGILSERDIIRGSYFSARDLDDIPVARLMTRDLIIASPDDEIQHIMQLMTQNRIRHVPVVEQGELLGVVSIGDVVKSLLEESAYEIQHLKNFLYGQGG